MKIQDLMWICKYSLLGIVILSMIGPGCSGDGTGELDGLSGEEEQLVNAMLKAEDMRPSDPTVLQSLYEGLLATNLEVQRIAIRGLGRMEQPVLGSAIVPFLAEDKPSVLQMEAANALAQSAYQGDIAIAYPVLLQALTSITVPEVQSAVAQALGRLPVHGADTLSRVEQALLAAAKTENPVALLGITRGFESFSRQHRGHDMTGESVVRLEALAAYNRVGKPIDQERSARIRRLSMATLVSSRRIVTPIIRSALDDPDIEVRRLAVRGIEHLNELDPRLALITMAQIDDHAAVRTEALRVYGRLLQKSLGCLVVLHALDDPDPHVVLSAIDLLGNACERGESHTPIINRLSQLTESLSDRGGPGQTWHRPAHALVALAGLAPGKVNARISLFAEHSVWQVRMYAARAAASIRSVSLLESLATDTQANVASTAINGMYDTVGHAADETYIEALKRDDYQLLLSAARHLAGSNHPEALPGLLEAFTRISKDNWETSRDPRRMMVERIGALGAPPLAETLRPYLRDSDPVIAERTAKIITEWTGVETQAEPQRLPIAAVPDVAELRTLEAIPPVLVMEDGREVTLRLRPLDAATNVARFVRLAKKGYYDGLTFHRVVPNFVIQGGSPGANEFMGDGPFTRDELTSRSHLRGTVGISTRGRDTGDAQIFVNLVDNVRLDHNYTMIAEVIDGMDVVDGLLEGAVIREVRMP